MLLYNFLLFTEVLGHIAESLGLVLIEGGQGMNEGTVFLQVPEASA